MTSRKFSSFDFDRFQSQLLAWYLKNRRDLPWRRYPNASDPYRIWVSEIMLQQTTVETVIPYYEKFLKRFPDISSLAETAEEEVLLYWSGLGYYTRARNLHRAAKMIAEHHQGQIPYSPDTLQKLPGIGRYTAGAIASIAYNQRAPILDGNVIRVLSRLFCLSHDPKSTKGKKLFWEKAEEILPQKRNFPFGDFNQALMELGATVCLPQNPLCPLCPVSRECWAHQRKRTAHFPKGKKEMSYQKVGITAAIIDKDGKILVIQRPENGLLRGLWEIPATEGNLETLLKKWPLKITGSLQEVSHSILNQRLSVTPVRGTLIQPASKTFKNIPWRWIDPAQIFDIPTSSMNRKIVSKILRK